jgi:hypothetical protein
MKPHNTEDQTTHEATKTHKIKQQMKPHSTEDQTTHKATKTHKIKQHMKPQKHIRSNNT